jgi:predicted amidohydrolase
VWIAAADKFGVEAESIVYCGRSCFFDPNGAIVAELGPEDDAALMFDVPIADARTPVERRPELYEVLGHPTESLPVLRTLDEPFVMSEQERQLAVVQMTMPPTGEEFLAAARRHVARLALQDAGLVLFPAPPAHLSDAYAHDAVLAGMERVALDTGVCLAFTLWQLDGRQAMYLAGPRGVIASHLLSHRYAAEGASPPLGDGVCPVVNTPLGRIGLMLDAEGFVPEVARSLMLRGAEIILWSAAEPPLPMAPFARARAEENRVFVACAAAPTAEGATMVVDPSGRPLATALEGRPLAVAAGVNRALSHMKQRAPGTDVVRNRQPATYGAITAAGAAAARVV